ncbi:MAG: PD-(D/E)XK nuclease family protein [Deferrisomatales bacterium]
MARLHMDGELVDALEAGAQLVVATRRLARHLRDRYDEAQEERGRGCWPSARVLPFEAWVRSLWESGWPEEKVIAEPLAGLLWEQVVEEDAGEGVLDTAATARSAREAYRLLQLYRIPFEEAGGESAEARALARWIRRYEERLRDRGWVDPAELPGRVREQVGRVPMAVPRRLYLAGFDEAPPLQRALVEALRGAGARVEELGFPRRTGDALRCRARDRSEEVRLAARWVRRELEAGAGEGVRLGVVVVGLEAYAARVEQVFTEELTPARALPGAPEGALPFDLSYGEALAKEPVVATALDLLSLGPEPASWELWASLLRSPFWGERAEALDRAKLEEALLKGRAPAWTAAQVQTAAQGAGLAGTARGVGELLAAWGEPAGTRRRLPSEWARVFAAVLDAARWARGGEITSREYQARQSFLETLGRLRLFDALEAPVGRDWALERLDRLCREPFRPDAPPGAVPVIGALEAAGLDFDRLWVLGLHGEAFPPPARPNPFLPYRLQVAHGVRQASPEAQLERARGMLRRLLGAADRVVVSTPETWEGAEVAPSPLVLDLPEGDPPVAPSRSVAAAVRGAPAVLEAAEDRSVPLGEAAEVGGGANLLADQAACPFRAFARHRLGAEGVEEPDEALDPRERGTGVHAALERFWTEVGSRRALEALGPEELHDVLERAARAGVAAIERSRRGLSPRLAELERARLVALLAEWVGCELQRDAFEVAEREAPREVEVAGLTLRVRVDRVDRTEGGGHLLVDYKTGQPKPERWFEERPREPQLPLYALACPEARGIAYGVVRPGECALKAAGEAGGLPGDVAGWEEQVARWRERLEGLAREIREGRAEVAPLDEEVCRYCRLPPLCRIDEAGFGEEAEGEEEP